MLFMACVKHTGVWGHLIVVIISG